MNDERGLVRGDGFDCPRVRAHRWRHLRLLQFYYAYAQAPAAGTLHLPDEADQHPRRYPVFMKVLVGTDLDGAGGGTRTHTPRREPDFESSTLTDTSRHRRDTGRQSHAFIGD